VIKMTQPTTRRRAIQQGLALALALPTGAAHAQAWPAKPVKIIVPYPPGGQTDIVSRWLGEKLQAVLGVPVVVDNKAGAQGVVGIMALKSSPADGYSMVYVNGSNLIINKFAMAKLPYDAPDDFELISQVGMASLGMIVSSALGLKTVEDFVRYAKANPGKTSFASFGIGSSSHLYGEMLKTATGIDSVHVPYKGAAPAVQDILGGTATMGIHDFATIGPQVLGGKATLLASTGTQRWPTFANTPTFHELGYPLDLVGWNGLMAPKGTPRAIVERLSLEINKIIQSPEGRARMLEMGLQATGTSPDEFVQIVRRDTPRWGAVWKSAGIPAQ
jgi:tripartite-type tricarboxylate transporter receptor subunit TctC